MNDDIQHHLVHARDLADAASRLAGASALISNDDLQQKMEATAMRLLERSDKLLESAI